MRYVELFNSIGLTIERILSQNLRAWYCGFWELVCSVNKKHKHCRSEELIATLEAIKTNIEADLNKEDYFEEIDENKENEKAALIIINYVNNFKKEN